MSFGDYLIIIFMPFSIIGVVAFILHRADKEDLSSKYPHLHSSKTS